MKKKYSKLLFILFTAMVLLLASAMTASAAGISKKKATIYAGKTTTLKIKGAKDPVIWESSDPEVATVSSKGKVKGISRGKATIKAIVGEKEYKCKVTVKSAIKLSKYNLTLKKAATVKVTLEKSANVTYTVSDANVCTCKWSNVWNPTYTETQLKLKPKDPGTATITITAKGLKNDKAVINVTVK